MSVKKKYEPREFTIEGKIHGVPVTLRYDATEFKVGQQVKDGDYARLPVGSKASGAMWVPITKTSDQGWTADGADEDEIPNDQWFVERTLTYLPEHAEPEDATDAYAEPEPLKEGDAEVTASAAIAQMANAMRDFATGFEKAGKIFWLEMQRFGGDGS